MSRVNIEALKYLRDASKIGQGRTGGEKIYNTVTSPFRLVGNAAADSIVGGARVAATNPIAPLTKKTDPGIQNLWTGRREGRGAIAIGAVAGAGYMGYTGFKQTELAPKTGEISYGGTAPVMDADGVSSTSQAPTLGAGGNMVFGLHNARKG